VAGIDINRTTSGVQLPPAVSSEIWQSAQSQSAVMQLARQIPLPGAGVSVPTITGDPTAQWVAETARKPVSRGTMGFKNIRGYTLAVIEPFSNQFRRDLPGLYQALVNRLPGVLAKEFDRTVFFGAAPGSDFDTFAGINSVSVANGGDSDAYDGFLAALAAGATAGSQVTGWALSAQGEIAALSARDGNGRPLFTSDLQNEGSIGRILGRPAYQSGAVYGAAASGVAETVGFAGDWDSALWGLVEGVTISVSDQATLNDGDTVINLWQQNMFAVRVEFEVGFRFRDAARFVRLTGAPALA